jgi:uncharacterized protein (DUF2267 family)
MCFYVPMLFVEPHRIIGTWGHIVLPFLRINFSCDRIFFCGQNLFGTFHVVVLSNLLAMLYHLDKHYDEATRFVKSVAKRLGTPADLEHAVRVLRSVFGVLRRRIVPDESLQLISKLPLIVKGIYVDGWNICEPLSETRTLDEFLFEVRDNSQGRAHLDFSNVELAKKKIIAVFNVLKQFVYDGELADILRNLSRETNEIV